MLRLVISLSLCLDAARSSRQRSDRGQATTEYALVLLAAASIALVLVAWATKTGKLTHLFDVVVDQVVDKAS